MNRILTLTEQQRDALGIALDEHFEERKNYLDTGSLTTDYGVEWPEVAATKADICERLGEVEEQLFGNADGAGRWNTLAKSYRESAVECAVERVAVKEGQEKKFRCYCFASDDKVEFMANFEHCGCRGYSVRLELSDEQNLAAACPTE